MCTGLRKKQPSCLVWSNDDSLVLAVLMWELTEPKHGLQPSAVLHLYSMLLSVRQFMWQILRWATIVFLSCPHSIFRFDNFCFNVKKIKK